ncbi:MAG: UPF0149 family protein [Desulfobulbaceae bacterium]|nr:UPF0149 family protein [Desulfobulbaceae bacterium]
MISKKEQQSLQEMLGVAEEQGCEAFTGPELMGFLHGLAITPDMVMPSEWLPVIFGGEMPEFKSIKQAQGYMDILIRLSNRFASAFHSNELEFPHNLIDPELLPLDDLLDWPRGFQQALMLRPECWLREKVPFAVEAEDQKIMFSLAIIAALADPEKAEEFFGELIADKADKEEEASLLASLIIALPGAVNSLQVHAAKLEKDRQAGLGPTRTPGLPVHSIKIGRNDPCPCGSGKKYKQCCLKGEKVVPLH